MARKAKSNPKSEKAPTEIDIKRFTGFTGSVRLPGSKSIANRVLLLSALGRGRVRIENVPDADDVQVMIRALAELGVDLQSKSGNIEISGNAGPIPVDAAEINLDNAGTALRPLCAVLAAGHGTYTIDGNEQMRKRPIGDLVRALRQLGVQIECRNSNYPPVTIHADGVAGGNATISGSVSSQFVSALLMMAPLIEPGNRLTIELKNDPVSKPYIDLTLFLMKDFGVDVERDGFIRFIIDSGQYDNPGSYYVEGDATAATYFLAAGALPGCGPVRVEGLGADSIQGDVEFTELLMDMGAVITLGPDWIESRGPAAGEKLKALNVDMNAMPDAAMTLAVMALFCDGKTSIRNIANLRVKESERIRGLKTELEKFGARVKEEKDALHITPPAKLKSAAVDTYQDHRMAMAFALAAYGADIQIKNPSCISKTYPQFFRDFLPLCQH